MCWESLCIHLSPQATTSSLHQLWMLNVHWRYTSSHRRGSESAVAPVHAAPALAPQPKPQFCTHLSLTTAIRLNPAWQMLWLR